MGLTGRRKEHWKPGNYEQPAQAMGQVFSTSSPLETSVSPGFLNKSGILVPVSRTLGGTPSHSVMDPLKQGLGLSYPLVLFWGPKQQLARCWCSINVC